MHIVTNEFCEWIPDSWNVEVLLNFKFSPIYL